MRAPQIQYVCNAGGEHARLAGSGAGKHQHRSVERLNRLALLRVEVGEIRRGAGAERTRGNTARGGLRAHRSGIVALRLGHVVRSRRL